LLQRHLQLPEDVQMRLPNKIILCCAVMWTTNRGAY
jgi:hypothetical protein